MKNFIVRNQLLFAWIVALVATSGSLYFSEVKGFIPCEWCWYQRILMYPMAIVLGMAYFRKDKNIFHYIKPISVIGILFAGVHYLEQKIGIVTMINGQGCTSLVPCSGQYINYFGFITIPFLSLIAFSLIFLISVQKTKQQD